MISMGGWGKRFALAVGADAVGFRIGVGFALLAWAQVASAIDIVPVLNVSKSEAPGFDSDGQGLAALMAHAEYHYENIFLDPHTVRVNYWYEDLDDSVIGYFNTVSLGAGRVTEANLRIDTRFGTGGGFRNWFVDPTPTDDGEFDMQSDLWGNTHWEHANFIAPEGLPAEFELGYRGVARSGLPAAGKLDMLSTVLHELGHVLGVRGGSIENNDGDYDFDPAWLSGRPAAAKVDHGHHGEPDAAHVLSQTMLMCGGCGESNARRRPSHADLLAMAAGNGFSQMVLPPRDFSGLLPGDANNDGMVTGADLIAVHENFARLGPPNDGTLVGDADDDGQVTGSDLIAVQQHFAGTAESSAVPEPAAGAPWALALVVLTVGSRVPVESRR